MNELYPYSENRQEENRQERQGADGSSPKAPGRKRAKKLAKKTGALLLSGLIVGASAGAAFQGVNAIAAGKSPAASESARKDSPSQESAQGEASKETTLSTGSGSSEGGAPMSTEEIAETVMPSIVSITNQSVQEVESFYDMFGMGGFAVPQEVESAGSGIIIGENEEELLLVTNYHVVEGADTLTVSFIDGSACEAVLKGGDSARDLAVIAVELSEIPEETRSLIRPVQMGDSTALQVGEQVVAIGNALGYGQSVTTGIVSALERALDGSEATFIQTDAAINPGNSGGALLNMQGELVGINSAKLASTEVEGMGYAIPLSEAQPILESLMARSSREKVAEDSRGRLGISGYDVDAQANQAYGLPLGIYVEEVEEGSAADAAGIVPGSIITKFDGTGVSGMAALQSQLQYYAAGETVSITIALPDQGEYREQELEITLDAQEPPASETPQKNPGFQAEERSIFGDLFGY